MSWRYDRAFVWIDNPVGGLLLGGSQHSEIIADWTEDVLANPEVYNHADPYQILGDDPILPGHIGDWSSHEIWDYKLEQHRPELNPENYKNGDTIAVFFSHWMIGQWKPAEMKQFKGTVINLLRENYPNIREATPEEHFKNWFEPTQKQLRWYTDMIDIGEEHIATRQPSYTDSYLQNLHPDEIHNAGGTCLNPKCDYTITSQDEQNMNILDGWWACPECKDSYNYWHELDKEWGKPGGGTRAPGLSMRQMGQIGETLIDRMGSIPGMGQIFWWADDYNTPLDFNIGKYGVEVKTNHSEAQKRFKIGNRIERQKKIQMANEHSLAPALIGVRLNFYTSLADIWWRQGFTDTWIGNPLLHYVTTIKFEDLNPYPDPQEVPPPGYLPEDNDTPAPYSEEEQFPF